MVAKSSLDPGYAVIFVGKSDDIFRD